MRALRRNFRFTGIALRLLLALGMVVNPVLAAVGELHGMEHAAMASAEDMHEHAHASDSQPHDHHGGGDDSDHASGGHGLLHQVGSASDPLPDIALDISVQSASGPLLPESGQSHLPGDSPNLPFRPPIA
ncbi:MAG: hypothetical protein ACLGHW_03460 [Gammaproteobacteria bacterium]